MKRAKILIIGLLTVALLAGLVLSPGCARPAEEEKEIKIAWIGEYLVHLFFIPHRVGIQDVIDEYAEKGVKVTIEWLGPPTYDVMELIGMVETVLAAGEVDGFILEAGDPTILFPVIERIKAEMGVPVLLSNELFEHGLYDGYWGYSPSELGAMIAEQLASHLRGESAWAKAAGFEGSDPVSGEVAFLLDASGRYSSETGSKAGRDYMAQFPGIVNVGLWDTTNDMVKAKEIMAGIMIANPNLVGIHSFGSTTTIASGSILEDLGLVGQVAIAGADPSVDTLQMMKDLSVASLVEQGTYEQGYGPTKALVEYLLYGTPIPFWNPTTLVPVTPANVDEFIKIFDDYGAVKTDF